MKPKAIISTLLLFTFLASCAPVATVVPEITPSPTPTYTPIPLSTVIGRALLSNEPEMNYCSPQILVPEGANVTVTGTYKDFAFIQFQTDAGLEEGFLPQANLSIIPAGVPELTSDQIPMKMVVDYSAWSYYSPENGGELVVTPPSDAASDWATDPTQRPVTVPLRIHFGLQNTAPWGGVKIVGTPEGSDPWWANITRMDISNNNGVYDICVHDGSTEGCSAEISTAIPSDQEVTLLFLDSYGKQLQILDQTDKVVREIDFTAIPGLNLPNGLFPNGWFIFGTTVGFPGTLKVTHLSITTLSSGIYEPSWLSEPGLAELAAPYGIMIGTEYHPDMMMDERYCQVVRHDFNLGALSVFTDAQVWLGPGDYNFTLLDQIVNDSSANGMILYASHLVWGSYDKGVLPDWLKNGGYSKAELLDILQNHIITLVTRYKDKVQIWSIANEAPQRDRWSGADFWFDHIGPEYVQKSFEWARQADPNAILILNADNNQSPLDADSTYVINAQYQMVKNMLENGVRVDAVGMQMHLFLPWNSQVMPNEADVEATMRMFGDLGVKVMITEMDVDLHEIPGTPQEKLDIQTQLYADMMTACINSGVCTAFMTWGVSDANSWISSPDSPWVYPIWTPDAAPLLFDTEFQPKPAYFAVLRVLEMK